ncbi:MAG: VWA domain-containing protein [Thiobacillus sp.]|nr:VWA domain-containing protein [Thiobacillus sp.]
MIDGLHHLYWREPLWLGLAAVPLLFAWWRGLRRARLLKYADAELLPWVERVRETDPVAGWRGALHTLAWLLLALAAAGPRAPLEAPDGQSASRHRVTVMVVVDVSASMRASDVAPDRLTRARLELIDWLPRLQGERVGLIVYAGSAGVLLPPTDDINLLRRAVEQIDPRLLDAPGSNLAAAIDLASAQLQAAPGQAKAVLLVSDAESGSADAPASEAVARLVKARIPLFVLGVGSEAGAPIPLPEGGWAEQDGVQVQSRMATTSFRQWAQTSGGRFVEVADGDSDWLALHDRGIAAVPGDAIAPGVSTAWREYYAWLLAPALVLLMAVSLPRRVVTAIAWLVVGAALQTPFAHADEVDAWHAWQQKQYASAQALYLQVGGYSGQMGAGASAWRLADYAGAARHFGHALLLAANDGQRANALYNLGNAHYGLGRYAIAAEAYEAVLKLKPNDGKARANLGWARQRLRRQSTDAPMQSDLRARRGMLAEGQIQLDGESVWRPDDRQSDPLGVQIDRRQQGALDARARTQAGARPHVVVNPVLAASGLKKLEHLDDRPQPMLNNLLKQDAQYDAKARAPW